jgi:hypothetical protein
MAQTTNINVFSDKGERFWVVINGIKQNAKASQHVKVTNLTGTFWKMRVVFENQNIPEVSQNVGTTEENQEFTYQVKKNRKEEYVIRIFSVAPISNASNAEVTIPYHATELPPVTTTTTTPNSEFKTNIEIKEKDETGFSLKVDEKGFDLKVNVKDEGTPNNTPPNNNPSNNNNSANNCWSPMNANEFAEAKRLVKKETFEENKMQVAQQFTRKNCLTIAQIKEIAQSFTFEENKFDYVKFAYNFCYDRKNYYQLGEIFTFSHTKDDLNDFLQDK